MWYNVRDGDQSEFVDMRYAFNEPTKADLSCHVGQKEVYSRKSGIKNSQTEPNQSVRSQTSYPNKAEKIPESFKPEMHWNDMHAHWKERIDIQISSIKKYDTNFTKFLFVCIPIID